jgi:hypothetical protein
MEASWLLQPRFPALFYPAEPISVKGVSNRQALLLRYSDFPNKFAASAVLIRTLSYFDE